MFVTKDNMKSMLRGKFCPGGQNVADDYSTLGDVLSVLMCMDWDSSALNKQMQLERDMDASASTLTFQDRQKSQKGPRTGPEDLAEIRKVVATYCAVVWYFLGELCGHYVECLTVLGALMSERAYTRRSLFTKNYCG